jgi:hypothetical protein
MDISAKYIYWLFFYNYQILSYLDTGTTSIFNRRILTISSTQIIKPLSQLWNQNNTIQWFLSQCSLDVLNLIFQPSVSHNHTVFLWGDLCKPFNPLTQSVLIRTVFYLCENAQNSHNFCSISVLFFFSVRQ